MASVLAEYRTRPQRTFRQKVCLRAHFAANEFNLPL
jgi:hypothetical protein